MGSDFMIGPCLTSNGPGNAWSAQYDSLLLHCAAEVLSANGQPHIRRSIANALKLTACTFTEQDIPADQML